MNQPPESFGISYRGPMAIMKSRKLSLPVDLHAFLSKALRDYRGKQVLITIHPVEEKLESIWSFMEDLEGRSKE